MADNKSFRISDETKEKFDKFAKGNFANADEAFNVLIDTYNLDHAATSEFGQSLKADLEAFRKYSEGITKLYTNAIDRGSDALDIATSKVRNRLDAQDATIVTLKTQVTAADERVAAAEKAQAEAEARAVAAEKKAEEQQSTVAALKVAMESLRQQLDATNALIAALKPTASPVAADSKKDDETSLFSN